MKSPDTQPPNPEKPLRQFATAREFADFLAVLGKDRIPEGVALDAVYIVSETLDNQQSGVETALALYKSGRARKIIICGEPARQGYCGVEAVRAMLHDVPPSDVVEVLVGEIFHTTSEVRAATVCCADHKMKNVALAAPSFHLPRAFVSGVTGVLADLEEHSINIWPAKGTGQVWKEEADHSQGKIRGTRIKLLQGEIDRLYKYCESGDLVSWAEVQRYMQERDKRISKTS